MSRKSVTATRRADRRAAQKARDAFRPGRGRQLECLINPLVRTEGLMSTLFERSDLDSEAAWVEYIWNHPKMVEIRDFVDAEEPGWAAEYKWPRSSLLFCAIVSLALNKNVTAAHNRVRSDSELRRIGGFKPRRPRRERRKLGDHRRRGDKHKKPEHITDPDFPVRQCSDDLINRWLGGKKPAKATPTRKTSFIEPEIVSERGWKFLALVEQATQEIAFQAILEYGLDTSRLTTDFSIILSGHKRDNPERTDYGAIYMKKKDKPFYGRRLGTVLLVGAPFAIVSTVSARDDGEPGTLKELLLPKAAEASERLVAFAAERGINHNGFKAAATCGDGAFHSHPCIEATFRNGFLPAYNVGGEKGEVIGTRELPVTGTGELRTVDLRDDGGLLCRCRQSMAHEKREPMSRRIELHGRSAKVSCDLCNTTYSMTPRGPDETTAIGERGDLDLRYDITLPRWDKRVIAIVFKARREIESMHSEMESMGLLPDGRGGDDWRRLTGNFRHDFWYSLAHLIWNIRVEYNLHQTEQREEYTWTEGYLGYTTNRKQMARQEELDSHPRRTGHRPPSTHPAGLAPREETANPR